jgi:UDP-GlcNAc:undecaprenyl-phosphate GlcNAc-1-phosphate transferase
VNAVNLLDGLDGLAAGVAAVSAAGFAIILDGDARLIAAGVSAALAGFLLWNRPPARIYLGDAGSYLVGVALAVLVAVPLGEGGSFATVAAAGLLVAVPVADTSIAVVRRWRAHRPLLVGDRGHVYDQLVDRRWTPARATVACVAAQALLAVLAVGVAHLPDAAAVAVTLTVTVAVGAWALRTFTTPASWAR